MVIIKTGIYLSEPSFGRALARSLSRESRNIIFEILDNLQEMEEMDLLICEERVGHKGEILLKNSEDDEDGIFRYSDSRAMINYLFFVYYKMTGRVISYKGNRKTKIIATASLGGGFGATSLTLGLCKVLTSYYDKKVLYFNVTTYGDGDKYLNYSKSKIGLKLLYYIRQGEEFPIEGFIGEGEYTDYILCDGLDFKWDFDLSSLGREYEGMGKYDFLFLDLGNEGMALLKSLGSIIDSLVIVDSFRDIIPLAYREKRLEKIINLVRGVSNIKIANFSDDVQGGYDFNVSKDSKAFIMTGDYIDFDLKRNFGNEIDEIAMRITGDVL